MIIYRNLRLHEHFIQLLLFPRVAKVISPKARLRPESLESQVSCLRVSDAALFAVDEGRKPLVLSSIYSPAIEIEVVAGQRRAAIRSVEAHDVEILILHPDASHEGPFTRPRPRFGVAHESSHLC